MAIQIRKRNGELQDFDESKVYKAIMRAAIASDVEDFGNDARLIAQDVTRMLEENPEEIFTVEEIQDYIEVDLYEIAYAPQVAKAYILYRDQRRALREKEAKFKDIIIRRAIASEESNQKANANLDENSFNGRMYEAAEDLWKEIALSDFMPKDIADLHRRDVFHIHDLARFALGQHNCTTVNMSELLSKGFKTRQTDLRPPSRFSTACQQIAVIFQIISQSQYGGIASGHIDFELAPFVEKSWNKIFNSLKEITSTTQRNHIAEQLLKDELKQGAEALVHNLASLQSRPGAQLPFTSLNLGLDISPNGREVSKAILNAMIAGVGPHHTTPPFPILCFQVAKGINRDPGDPNYDLYQLAIQCATKRLTPNFVNADSSVAHSDINNPDTYLTAMGCRTQMGKDRFNKEVPYNRIGRGNLAPLTIIPVSLGIKYGVCKGHRDKPDLEGFEREFKYLLEKAEESLIIRANLIFRQKMKFAYELYVNPVWKSDVKYDPEASVYEVLKHGSLVIGSLGWAETLKALFGKHHGESEEAADYLEHILHLMNDFVQEASERNNLNFAVYHTPAENTCYTAMKKLKKEFGDNIEGVTDHEYLTNSVHIPVYYDIDIFEKIKKESRFSKEATGGNIVYAEFDTTAVHNLKAVEEIINYAMDCDVPYFAFNFPLDECTLCGYSGEISSDGCPQCGAPDEKINRLRRVTGYITSDYRRAFNEGKQAEVHDRVKHTKGVKVEAQ